MSGTHVAFLWWDFASWQIQATTGDLNDPKTIVHFDVGADNFSGDSIFLAPDNAIIWQKTYTVASGDLSTYIGTWSPRQPVITILDQGLYISPDQYGITGLSLSNSLATWFHDGKLRSAQI